MTDLTPEEEEYCSNLEARYGKDKANQMRQLIESKKLALSKIPEQEVEETVELDPVTSKKLEVLDAMLEDLGQEASLFWNYVKNNPEVER
ncbi:hypothetical protein MUP77_13760, partial [Candidatus Bathyarchaeota archaeon]|nr:hypothetical protein [Candidatus Bathyarchaeota archaeon]